MKYIICFVLFCFVGGVACSCRQGVVFHSKPEGPHYYRTTKPDRVWELPTPDKPRPDRSYQSKAEGGKYDWQALNQ